MTSKMDGSAGGEDWTEGTSTAKVSFELHRLALDGPAQLVALAGPNVGRKYPVHEDVTIGRGAEARVCIEERVLSRFHAQISRTGDGRFVLEDLKSKNGTFVNDEQVTRVELQFGDKIRLGRSVLLFTHHNPLEEQLAHKSKMEILGRLAAGIAHDFNNLLAVMVATDGYLDSLPQGSTLSHAEVEQCRTDLRESHRRAAELTSRLLGVARQGDHTFGRICLSTLCSDLAALVRRTFPQSIEVTTDIEPQLEVLGDRGQLHQMLLNICLNARDAMASGGRLFVRAGAQSSPALASTPPHARDRVWVAVSDTGHGMDAETRKRAFDPFFTTKPRDQGTGLGLATVAETATYHGGRVIVESEPGEGTTFRICLPAAPSQRPGATLGDDSPAALLEPPSPQVRVLLVDDDPAIRRSVGRLLRYQGFDVLLASNGAEAIHVYADERPDVVVLDLDMPVLGGRPAFGRLREMDPKARVLFMSGHWADRYDHEYGPGDAGPVGFLPKPCDPDELQQAIHSALQGGSRHSLGASTR